MNHRQNLFEIKAGLANILYFGSSMEEREFGGLRSEHWEKIKVDGDRIHSLAGYFHSLTGLASVQYDNQGKLEFIGGFSVRYWDGKITYIGSHSVTYDYEHPHRLKKIGALLVKYAEDNRIFSVGGERITYSSNDCIYDNPTKFQNIAQQEAESIANANKTKQDHTQQVRLERLEKEKKENLAYQEKQAKKHKEEMDRYRLKCAQNEEVNKREIPQLLALLIVIVNNSNYWKNMTRLGSMPKGVGELKNYLDECLNTYNVRMCDFNHLQAIELAISQQPLPDLISMLSSLATKADGFYSKDHWEFHQIFRGRDPKVNNFYGVISGLTQHGFAGGSAYYTAKQRYFPNQVIQYLSTEFPGILYQRDEKINTI